MRGLHRHDSVASAVPTRCVHHRKLLATSIPIPDHVDCSTAWDPSRIEKTRRVRTSSGRAFSQDGRRNREVHDRSSTDEREQLERNVVSAGTRARLPTLARQQRKNAPGSRASSSAKGSQAEPRNEPVGRASLDSSRRGDRRGCAAGPPTRTAVRISAATGRHRRGATRVRHAPPRSWPRSIRVPPRAIRAKPAVSARSAGRRGLEAYRSVDAPCSRSRAEFGERGRGLASASASTQCAPCSATRAPRTPRAPAGAPVAPLAQRGVAATQGGA